MFKFCFAPMNEWLHRLTWSSFFSIQCISYHFVFVHFRFLSFFHLIIYKFILKVYSGMRRHAIYTECQINVSSCVLLWGTRLHFMLSNCWKNVENSNKIKLKNLSWKPRPEWKPKWKPINHCPFITIAFFSEFLSMSC